MDFKSIVFKNECNSICLGKAKNQALVIPATCVELFSVKQEAINQKWIPHQVRNDNIDPKRFLETKVSAIKMIKVGS